MPLRLASATFRQSGQRASRLAGTALLLCSSLALAHAQKVLRTTAPAPGAPGSSGAAHTVSAAAFSNPASLNGRVMDAAGALIPGAHLALRNPAAGTVRVLAADADGAFHFTDLPPGDYALAVSAPGFETTAVDTIGLRAGETRNLPDLSLGIPVDHADVVVTLTRTELATEEMHAEEHQRILGFPDFYTSYVPNPEPLNTGQKFQLALRATTDRMSFAGAALIAGGEQVQNTFPAYGGGIGGYAKRYGAAYTDGLVGKMIGSALLPSVFRQDPRYFYEGTGTLKHRALHAVLSAVVARGDNGRMEPNYSHILGNAAAGAISTLYHPATDSAGKLAFDNALLGTLGEAGVNLVREFVLKRFTHGL